jgi:hypothetical protein
MAALDIIKKLEAAHERLNKEQILIDAWMNGEREFFTAAQLACNFDIDFKLSSVPRIDETEDDPNFVPTFTWNDFLALVKKLRNPACTSEQAKVLVRDAVVQAPTLEWNNVYRDVLLHRWRVEERMINKILRKLSSSDQSTLQYLIAELKFQDYHPEKDHKKLQKLRGPRMLDIIPGGFRALLVLNKEHRTAIAYNGLINNIDASHFTEQLSSVFDSLPCSLVVDCVHGAMDTYHMIDCMPLDDYYKGVCNMPQRDRHTILTGVVGVMLALLGSFKVVPKLNVDLDTEVGRQNLIEYLEMAGDSGATAIGVKDPDAPYEFGKTKNKNWLKFFTEKE